MTVAELIDQLSKKNPDFYVWVGKPEDALPLKSVSDFDNFPREEIVYLNRLGD